jgi:4-hydroxy-tetrahydrodipicolinate reductase
VTGRMGQASLKAVLDDTGLQLVGACSRASAKYVGQDVSTVLGLDRKVGIVISNDVSDTISGGDGCVLLDFTKADIAFENAKLAMQKRNFPVIGTSGLSPGQVQTLTEISSKQRVGGLIVPNFSVGAVLMMEFAKQAASLYSDSEIIELHHKNKPDAPSGTAMYTLAKMASQRGVFNCDRVAEKELIAGARGGLAESGLRVHSLRLPGLISHQEVLFGGQGELLKIQHSSFNTDCFIKGILLALHAVQELRELKIGLENIMPLSKP